MKIFLLVAVFAVSLMVIGVGGGAEVQHAVNLGQAVASDPTPYHLTGNTWSIPDLSAPQSGYAFAQTPDSAPPAFVSSILDMATGNLTITFSEEIDAANVVPASIHMRESGTYTGGVTLTATELVTIADGTVISFALNVAHLEAVAAMTEPELTIDPGAVRDTYGSLIVGTFDVSTASFVDATSISSQEDTPTGIAFSSDGTKMFVVGWQKNAVIEYELSTPFDASTRTWVDDTSISEQEDTPTDIAFSSDGTRMFVIGDDGDDVNEYALSTPFDASTRTFVDATSIQSQETLPTGIAFSSDGTRMFVIGDAGDDVNEYTLSTPFDASTRTFVDATSISEQETFPTGIVFSSDGTRMFVIGDAGDDVNEYTLSTPFDASTRTFVDATPISEQESIPTGIAFSIDGAKMFVIGDDGDDVNEYTLSSVYPITVTDPTAGAFVTTWTATDSDRSITLPIKGAYSILWGDGSNSTNVSGSQSHTYGAAGDYAVTVLGDGLEYIHLYSDGANALQLKSIDQWGDTRWTTMDRAFYGARNMVYNATDSPDLDLVMDMHRMFHDATSFDGDLSSWDVSSVTDMSSMFRDATSFDQPLNAWDVSSVTDMALMFIGAIAFNQNLANWYVVQDPPVLTANAMFPIRAQNSYLDDLVPTYSIDDTRFVMDGKILSLNSTNLPPAGMYSLDITAPAVLGEPNAGEKGHTRTLSVTVKEHRPFITTWTASVSDYGITLPMVGTYSVLWGDGSNSTNVSGSQSHMYSVAGDYAVTVLGGGLEYIRLHGDDANALQLKSIDQWGDTRWTTMHEAFSGARNMVYNATDSPDLSHRHEPCSMFTERRPGTSRLSPTCSA